MHVLAIDGSPRGAGRTSLLMESVLAGAAERQADVELRYLAGPEATDRAQVCSAALGADALVIGSPVYRASFAYPLKELLDGLPRGMWGETDAPLQGKAVAIVATGATWHHFLALNDLRNVLCGFFAAHVLPPGIYAPGEAFDQGKLTPEFEELAIGLGQALVAFAALADDAVLRAVRPQA